MNSRWGQKRSFQGVAAVVTDQVLVNEPGSCRKCSVATAVDQTDRTFSAARKYPKERFVRIGQIDCKTVRSGRLVARRAEHRAGLMAIVAVLAAAAGEPEDPAQASMAVWILEVVALPT